MEKIMTTLRKVAAGLDFAKVASAFEGMHNISSHELRDGGEVKEFLRERGLLDTPHVFMATHSMGGRRWKIVEGRHPAFYDEPCFSGGWHVLTDEDCTYLYCESATSGSSLTAEKQKDGTWTVTLEVPAAANGEPYKGFYWGCFHSALGLEQPSSEEAPVEE
ncbi:MAG: hypothetical protein AAB849_02940 [Patescibacteria group bacterium]